MLNLIDELDRITTVLNEAGIAFEVIGGVAVNAHIFADHRSRTFVTRDIDILIRREDLPTLTVAAEASGYSCRKIVGGFMLLKPGQSPSEAVHLIFCGERSKSTQPTIHPEIHPEQKHLFGITIPVAPLFDLVTMKLNSFRPKDLVHLEILDEAGLITTDLECDLPTILRERLATARQTFAENQPDVE
jgi:hypothetical protein